jgi:hypothetical protein
MQEFETLVAFINGTIEISLSVKLVNYRWRVSSRSTWVETGLQWYDNLVA